MIRKKKPVYTFIYDYYCYYILLPFFRLSIHSFITITQRKIRTGTFGLHEIYYYTILIYIYDHSPA